MHRHSPTPRRSNSTLSRLLAVAAVASGAGLAQAQPIFGEPQFWGFAGDYAVAPGDFNNDGAIDIFSVAPPRFDSFGQLIDPGDFTLNLNTDGMGSFSSQEILDDEGVYTVFAADVNADGNLDVVDGDLGIMLGDGDGNFGARVIWDNGRPHGAGLGMAFGDMDDDGDLDIVVPNDGPVLLNNGDGTFYTNFVSSDVAAGSHVGVGDINEDGVLDIATIRVGRDYVTIQLGLGDGLGNPGQPYTVPIGAENPVDMALTDMNRDGHLDLVTFNDDTDDISVILGNGDGSFGGAAVYGANQSDYFEVEKFIVADVNGDNAPDVLATSVVYGNAEHHLESVLFLNDGDSLLTADQTIIDFGGRYTKNTAAADLNGDGSTDLFTATDILFNQSTGCPPDFNGDGAVDTRDVLAFLSAWSAGDDTADFNGDGDINTLDVLAFLSAWSSGC